MTKLAKYWDRILDRLFSGGEEDRMIQIVRELYDYARLKLGNDIECKIYSIYIGVYFDEVAAAKIDEEFDRYKLDDPYLVGSGDSFYIYLIETANEEKYLFMWSADSAWDAHMGNFCKVEREPDFMLFKNLIDDIFIKDKESTGTNIVD